MKCLFDKLLFSCQTELITHPRICNYRSNIINKIFNIVKYLYVQTAGHSDMQATKYRSDRWMRLFNLQVLGKLQAISFGSSCRFLQSHSEK